MALNNKKLKLFKISQIKYFRYNITQRYDLSSAVQTITSTTSKLKLQNYTHLDKWLWQSQLGYIYLIIWEIGKKITPDTNIVLRGESTILVMKRAEWKSVFVIAQITNINLE